MKKFAALLATTMVVATPIVAQQAAAPVVIQPVVATSADWTGGYVGLSAGAGEAETDSLSEDLTSYGVFGGYNYDMGQAVAGVDFSYDRLDADDTDGEADLYRVMARVGYDGGNFMPYVTAGYAYIEDDDASEDGYAYGIGVDYRSYNNFTIGAQYLQHEFDDVDNSGDDMSVGLFQIRAGYQF